MSWCTFALGCGDIHVVPIADIKPHELSRECPCNPTIIPEEDGDIIENHAWDFREVREELEEGTLLDEIDSRTD